MFVKLPSSFKGHSLSDNLDDVQRAEMKAYMELVNNMLLTAEVQTSTASVTLMLFLSHQGVLLIWLLPPPRPSLSTALHPVVR